MRRVNRGVRIAIAVAVAGIAAGVSTSVFAAKTKRRDEKVGSDPVDVAIDRSGAEAANRWSS